MPDFIPTQEEERDEFFANFERWVRRRGGDFGFSEREVLELASRRSGTARSRSEYRRLKEAAREARLLKDRTMASEEELVRAYFRRLEAHPKFTDEDRTRLGKRSADEASSGSGMLAAPKLLLDHGQKGRAIIHWGPRPDNEHRNGKPPGAFGALVQYASGLVAPKDPDAWRPVPPTGLSTDSPLIHEIDNREPVSLVYRAAYVNRTMKLVSVFSAPASGTITPP